MDTIFHIIGDAISAFVRFILTLHRLPARRRERRRLRREAEQRDRADREAADRHEAARKSLVGRRGAVIRPLRPFGVILVDDQPHDAVSDRDFVEVGANVKIVAIQGQAYRVRPDDGAPPAAT